jgi:hypothetical protein
LPGVLDIETSWGKNQWHQPREHLLSLNQSHDQTLTPTPIPLVDREAIVMKGTTTIPTLGEAMATPTTLVTTTKATTTTNAKQHLLNQEALRQEVPQQEILTAVVHLMPTPTVVSKQYVSTLTIDLRGRQRPTKRAVALTNLTR